MVEKKDPLWVSPSVSIEGWQVNQKKKRKKGEKVDILCCFEHERCFILHFLITMGSGNADLVTTLKIGYEYNLRRFMHEF
ncbi:MAG: hypothetical protein VXZ77_04415 [Pseudomonadota bacterium]|nr:hypothetical protein [Pseudomonadota bacterium]